MHSWNMKQKNNLWQHLKPWMENIGWRLVFVELSSFLIALLLPYRFISLWLHSKMPYRNTGLLLELMVILVHLNVWSTEVKMTVRVCLHEDYWGVPVKWISQIKSKGAMRGRIRPKRSWWNIVSSGMAAFGYGIPSQHYKIIWD